MSIQPTEELFRLMVANVRDYAIFMLDASGHIATWNLGAERIKGYRVEEIIGKHFSIFYPESDVRAGKCEMELEVATREGRFEDEGWRVRKDGTMFWANVVINAVRDDNGTLVGFSKVTRDLTERKRAEEERTARLAAEEASRTKDDFLAMLGHELRNPLAPILTALQLLKLRGDPIPLKEHQIIERQVDHMMHLVDDLLDVSRISRGKLELRRKHFDLRPVIAKAIEIASPLFEQREHHFRLDVPNHALGVDGDDGRLTQVFANLLTNAAKYSEHGAEITTMIAVRNGEIVVAIKDSGIGIDPSLLPRIFDLFVQGYRTSERTGGGLGLGLTLVKRLVELHGGSVTADSEGLGHGSTFTVRLPYVALTPVERVPARSAKVTSHVVSRRILIVDDNEDALVLLGEALQVMGHDVRTATDPHQALALLLEFTPDIAILDIGLPFMDGYELAARILKRFDANAPRLFALSGFGQPSDRERSVNAGFAEHFVKPVDIKQLIESIAGG